MQLAYCSSLQQLPDSIGALKGLQQLNLWACSSLQQLPDSIGALTGLQQLQLGGCSSLQLLPDNIGAGGGLMRMARRRLQAWWSFVLSALCWRSLEASAASPSAPHGNRAAGGAAAVPGIRLWAQRRSWLEGLCTLALDPKLVLLKAQRSGVSAVLLCSFRLWHSRASNLLPSSITNAWYSTLHRTHVA